VPGQLPECHNIEDNGEAGPTYCPYVVKIAQEAGTCETATRVPGKKIKMAFPIIIINQMLLQIIFNFHTLDLTVLQQTTKKL